MSHFQNHWQAWNWLGFSVPNIQQRQYHCVIVTIHLLPATFVPHKAVSWNYLQSLFPRAAVASRLASAALDNTRHFFLHVGSKHAESLQPKRLRALGYDHPWTTEVAALVFSLKTKSCLRPLTSKKRQEIKRRRRRRGRKRRRRWWW